MENSDLIIGVLFVVALGLLCAWLLTLRMYKSEKKEVRKWVSRYDYIGKKAVEYERKYLNVAEKYEEEFSNNFRLSAEISELSDALRLERTKAKDRTDVADVKDSEDDFDDSELDELTKDDADDEKDDAGD